MQCSDKRLLLGRRRVRMVRSALFALCAIANVSTSASLNRVDIPEQCTLSGATLHLNGFGLRTATVLNVKIFVMALYAERALSRPDAVLTGTTPMRVWQCYLREVDSATIARGWRDNLASHNESLTGIEPECEQFGSAVQRVRKGSIVTYDFAGDSLVVTFDGARKPAVRGTPFLRALLNVWFGPRTTQTHLRDQLLGSPTSR